MRERCVMSLQQQYENVREFLPLTQRQKIQTSTTLSVIMRDHDYWDTSMKKYSEHDKLKESPQYEGYKSDFRAVAVHVCALNGDLDGFDKWVSRTQKADQKNMDLVLFSDEEDLDGASGFLVLFGKVIMHRNESYKLLRIVVVKILDLIDSVK